MSNQFEEFQKMSSNQMEHASAATASMARGFQAIASETSDYTKRSFENTSSFVEKLVGVRSVDTAIQLQTEFAKSQFEGFLSQASKITDICKDMAKEAFKPVESAMDKAASAARQ